MPIDDRGGLKAAFSNFNKTELDGKAELKLLGRTIDQESHERDLKSLPGSYQGALPGPKDGPIGGLSPKPLYKREAVRQISLRCPLSTAAELRRKAAFNQLEQQEIILEGIKRILLELPEPPSGWE